MTGLFPGKTGRSSWNGQALPVAVPTRKTDPLDSFANSLGGHPSAVTHPSVTHDPLMDFAGMEFPEGVSFSGRGLFWADFSKTAFRGQADFRDVMFVGGATFSEAKFLSTKWKQKDEARFIDSSFHGEALFHDVQFPDTTRFDQAVFHGSATFLRAKFMPKIGGSGLSQGFAAFWHSRFEQDVNFNNAIFGVGAYFENAKFGSDASFDKTDFQSSARFNNTEFGEMTSFREASFGKPPKFFETNIHEDVNFNGIDWSGAERSYSRRHGKPDSIVKDAEDAIRAWDRLALIMGEQEKLSERHMFYRLMMRAQRQRDGYRSLSSIANWLFEKSSDYGWGIGLALGWWGLHIVAGAGILTIAASRPMMVWNSLLVSFANSIAFLRPGLRRRFPACLIRGAQSNRSRGLGVQHGRNGPSHSRPRIAVPGAADIPKPIPPWLTALGFLCTKVHEAI